MSYSSGSCLPARGGFRATCVIRFRILPPYREGSRASCVLRLWLLSPCQEGSSAVTACPVVSCVSLALSIKKRQVGLSLQLDVHAPNTRTPVPKPLGVRAIISPQDVRTDNTISACKTCEQAAIVWLNSAAPRG
jgi:hypothetical protein